MSIKFEKSNFIISAFVIASLLLFLFPLIFSAIAQETDEQTSANIISSDMLNFVLDARWGNVRGEVSDKAETNFDGSISVATNLARVSLIRHLKFEDNDSITSERDPVSWKSLIFDHWDGVRALVSSPADQNITITTTQGNVTKTARELFSLSEPLVVDAGNGREIVIRTHPAPRHTFVAKIIWGKPHAEDYTVVPQDCDRVIADTLNADTIESFRPLRCRNFTKENFSGSLKIDSGAAMKLLRELRFEQNDSILVSTEKEISWESIIYGGVDGLVVRFGLNRNIGMNDKVTLTFNELGWSESISLLRLYHEKQIVKRVKDGYGVFISVREYPNATLLKAKNDPNIYKVEDGAKRLVPSVDVFNESGLEWDEVVEVEQAELDALAEDDTLGYLDGTLIQGDGPEVYVIADGKKRHIASAAAFNNLGYNWSKIRKVSNKHLSIYREDDQLTDSLRHPEGTLLREEGKPMVYLVEGGKKRAIPSLEVFNSRKLNWNNVLVVAKNQIDRLNLGNTLSFGDGAVIADPTGKVYRIDKGEKRWIRSGDDFVKSGEKWEDIVPVSASDANGFENGLDILADDL